jgi:hypothetical protein
MDTADVDADATLTLLKEILHGAPRLHRKHELSTRRWETVAVTIYSANPGLIVTTALLLTVGWAGNHGRRAGRPGHLRAAHHGHERVTGDALTVVPTGSLEIPAGATT